MVTWEQVQHVFDTARIKLVEEGEIGAWPLVG